MKNSIAIVISLFAFNASASSAPSTTLEGPKARKLAQVLRLAAGQNSCNSQADSDSLCDVSAHNVNCSKDKKNGVWECGFRSMNVADPMKDVKVTGSEARSMAKTLIASGVSDGCTVFLTEEECMGRAPIYWASHISCATGSDSNTKRKTYTCWIYDEP